MGNERSRIGHYMKLTSDERFLIKQIWMGIENNPQFHGSVFFMGFCEIYPQYIKYFSSEPRIPLSFDSQTNAKFTVIMETMGYLLLDFHNKPKQLDQIIGYVAMVHKDMNLDRSDMRNFGVSLLEYLSVTFPMTMTPECLEVTTKYMYHLLDEISQKIENFKNDEILERYEMDARRTTSSLNGHGSSSSRRLTDSKMRRPLYQRKTREETVQEETALITEPPDAPILTPRERRRISKALQSKNEAEAPASNIQANFPGSSRRSIANGEQRETPQAHLAENEIMDSSARSRRRISQEKAPRSSSPNVYF